MAYRNRKGAFFSLKPPVTRDSDTGSRSLIRAAPVAQVRLRCLNPIVQHRFKTAYKIRCPACHYDTIEIGKVDGLTKSQGSR